MQGNAGLRPSGARTAQIDALVEKGVKGVILAGVGDGDTTDAAA
jgi:L-asparaginase/Glu-tRNA(Gln) amidotransferase subunit D